jgi:hypothetical protein
MPGTDFITPPRLVCRELPAFHPDKLETVRAAFASAERCALRQAWLSEPEKDFTPATVCVGRHRNSLLVFAELEDADIFTGAKKLNERMWELGDTLEIFLAEEHAASYVEFHVTPNNQRLQLRFPSTEALRQAQKANVFDPFLLAGRVFYSQTWVEQDRWFVYAEIPAVPVCGMNKPLAGTNWKFSFSRYDYVRGRKEPIYSSTSPHAKPDYHRREEWGTLSFA